MLEKMRSRLAHSDGLPLLAFFGLCCGVISGGVIIMLRLFVESSQAAILLGADHENYEALSVSLRFALPVLGGVLIVVIYRIAGGGAITVGVVHVLERLVYYQGHLPFKNFVVQFFAAAVSLICGHSVGREGPGIHLGAASSSLLGQYFHLPNNSIRILVACGAASSIAASFNTPIAGVVFAMEVIVMEYTIASFSPVILSSVSATVLTHYVFGGEPAFVVPALELASLLEFPLLLAMGVVIGSVAALFIGLTNQVVQRSKNVSFEKRILLAGFLTGVVAMFAPQVMGIGYDTVNASLVGGLSLGLLLIIIISKLLITTIGIGLGLPGGLIGPTLVVGATAGGLFGLLAAVLFPGEVASPGFYAMIGMGAMMGATLQAPLAALLALLELTLNTNIIMPGMFVIIVAGLTSSHLYHQQGIFLTLLKARGLDYRSDPVTQSLRSVSVTKKMDRDFVRTENNLTREEANALLSKNPHWVLIDNNDIPQAVMFASDLVSYMNMNQVDVIDLYEVPGRREDFYLISMRDTLQHALNVMRERKLDVLCVGLENKDSGIVIHGVITRQAIESHYSF